MSLYSHDDGKLSDNADKKFNCGEYIYSASTCSSTEIISIAASTASRPL